MKEAGETAWRRKEELRRLAEIKRKKERKKVGSGKGKGREERKKKGRKRKGKKEVERRGGWSRRRASSTDLPVIQD